MRRLTDPIRPRNSDEQETEWEVRGAQAEVHPHRNPPVLLRKLFHPRPEREPLFRRRTRPRPRPLLCPATRRRPEAPARGTAERRPGPERCVYSPAGGPVERGGLVLYARVEGSRRGEMRAEGVEGRGGCRCAAQRRESEVQSWHCRPRAGSISSSFREREQSELPRIGRSIQELYGRVVRRRSLGGSTWSFQFGRVGQFTELR